MGWHIDQTINSGYINLIISQQCCRVVKWNSFKKKIQVGFKKCSKTISSFHSFWSDMKIDIMKCIILCNCMCMHALVIDCSLYCIFLCVLSQCFGIQLRSFSVDLREDCCCVTVANFNTLNNVIHKQCEGFCCNSDVTWQPVVTLKSSVWLTD